MPRRSERYGDDDNGWATVIGIDPGGTTGWAVMCVEQDALSDPDVSILRSIAHKAQGQVAGDEDKQAMILIELIAAWPSAAVVIEDFILRKFVSGRELLSPVRITAKVEFALKYGLLDVGRPRDVFKQQPSLAMKTATDDRMKDWGLYIREGGEEHARDAMRHCITFMRRAGEKPALRSAAWPRVYGEDGELLPPVEEEEAS